MYNKPKRRRSLMHLNPWTVLGIYLVFILLAIVAFIAFIGSYASLQVSPVLSEQPVMEAVTTTPTILTSSSPQPSLVGQSLTPQLYTVQEGDTLYRIALQFGVTIDAIKAANGLPSDLINAGQQLVIPVVFTPVAIPTPPIATAVEAISNPSRYQVRNGDTLDSIAASHGVTVAELRNGNSMIGDTLLVGQFITIPLDHQILHRPWKFSSIDGDLAQEYPLALYTDRFTLHYQPDTFPAQDPAVLAQLELSGLAYLESLTGLKLESKYDVYVAGTNFGPPDKALRGRGTSVLLRTFFLHDGTGNPDDQQYIVTHELTHLFMWNTVGSPSSTMLSEGTAVYFGMEKISGSGHMPLDVFCAAFLQASALPNVSNPSLSYLGHILDLQNYYAAGCFVKYLVDRYGIEPLKLVYHSGDYMGVYGRNITDLESDCRIHLSGVSVPIELDPIELVGSVNDLENIYRSFFSTFNGSPSQFDAYRELDKARIALLQGRLSELHQLLDGFRKIVNGT